MEKNSFEETEKNKLAKNSETTKEIFSNEVSLFGLKYKEGTSVTGEPVSDGPFTLELSTQYESSVSDLISQSKHPNSTVWSIFRRLSDGNPVYIIFTKSETIVWSAECDRETVKFVTGPIERGNAVICETETSVSLICTTRRNSFILVPDIFNPKLVNFDVASPIKQIVALPGENEVLVTCVDKSAATFNLESNSFNRIQFSKVAWLNIFRNPFISECDQILACDDAILGFTNEYITVYDVHTFQSIRYIRVPRGRPVSVSQFGNSVFILTKESTVIRVTGVNGESQIQEEKVEKDIGAFSVTAISENCCAVCGNFHIKIASFNNSCAALKVSDSFDNFLLGCWETNGKMQILTSRGGATALFVDEPEATMSQIDLLSSMLSRFIAGDSVYESLSQNDIYKETFIELDNRIIKDKSTPINQKIVNHRMLTDLAMYAHSDFDETVFASNLLELSMLRSAENDKFEEATSEIRSSAYSHDVDRIFSLVSLYPDIYAEAFMKIIDSSFTEITDILNKDSKKLRISSNKFYITALNSCLSYLKPEDEMYSFFCRYLAFTNSDCTDAIFKLFNANPESAIAIIIESHSYKAAAKVVDKSRNFAFLEEIVKEDGEKCISPIISYFNSESKISSLLELGKIKEFRKPVSRILAADNAMLAFNLIQEDSTDEELIEAANMLYEYVREERKALCISQAAALVAVGIFCCQAAGQNSANDQPLNKLKNRAIVYMIQGQLGLPNRDVLESTTLAKNAISKNEIKAALCIIAATYDDRNDEGNADIISEAIKDCTLSVEEMRNLFVETLVALNIPESLEKSLYNKIDDLEKRENIWRAFRFANAMLHTPGNESMQIPMIEIKQ